MKTKLKGKNQRGVDRPCYTCKGTGKEPSILTMCYKPCATCSGRGLLKIWGY